MSSNNDGIVILGAPRSGTTLVRRILNAHSGIASPGETCVLSACARFLETEIVADGLEFGVLSGLAFAGFKPDESLARLREFAVSFNQEFAQRQGKRRWAEKTAVDIFHAERIGDLLSDSVHYVFVVRHGLDVACSMQEFSDRGYTYLRELHEFIGKHPRPLEAFAHAWVDAIRRMEKLAERFPEKSHVLRYEDLVEDPARETGRLLASLGEEMEPGLLEAAMGKPESTGFGDWKTYSKQKIENSSIRRWQKLPPSIVRRLGEICNETLSKYGYETVDSAPAPNQAAARRKYEFSLTFGANRED